MQLRVLKGDLTVDLGRVLIPVTGALVRREEDKETGREDAT